jgi:hypothetical protein
MDKNEEWQRETKRLAPKKKDSDRKKGKIAHRLSLAINVFSKLMYPLDLKGTSF